MNRWPRTVAVLALSVLGIAFLVAPVSAAAGGSAGPAATTAPVYLNHTIGVYSEETIEALQTNKYLSEQFVEVMVRTTVRPDITYTGTYLMGRETYVEFFPVGTLGWGQEFAGLALGDETAGGIQTVRDAWVGEFGESRVSPIELVSREVEGQVVPWFWSVHPVWVESAITFAVWNMEFVPDPGSDRPRTRRESLAERYNPGKLAENVQALSYGLADAELTQFRRTLSSVGWHIRDVGSGYLAFSPIDAGTSRVLHVTPAGPGRQGLLGIVWKLNRNTLPHVEQIGDAVLTVGVGGQPYATLWFVPPRPGEQELVLP